MLDANKNVVAGVTVTFSDGGKGGILTPATVVTDSAGKARASYQLPSVPGKYIVTATSTGLNSVRFGETAVTQQPTNVAIVSGDNQTTTAGSALPQPLVVHVMDQVGSPIAGTSVNFTAPSGSFTGNPATTDANGNASVTYTAGTSPGTITITATAGSVSAIFHETVTAASANSVTITGGDNQSAPAGSQLLQALSVVVDDQYNNFVPGATVSFDDGGAGGQFSGGNLVITDGAGMALNFYTLPAQPGPVTITASVAGVANSALFSEIAK